MKITKNKNIFKKQIQLLLLHAHKFIFEEWMQIYLSWPEKQLK